MAQERYGCDRVRLREEKRDIYISPIYIEVIALHIERRTNYYRLNLVRILYRDKHEQMTMKFPVRFL